VQQKKTFFPTDRNFLAHVTGNINNFFRPESMLILSVLPLKENYKCFSFVSFQTLGNLEISGGSRGGQLGQLPRAPREGHQRGESAHHRARGHRAMGAQSGSLAQGTNNCRQLYVDPPLLEIGMNPEITFGGQVERNWREKNRAGNVDGSPPHWIGSRVPPSK
jgi:hypothetical protein